MAEFVAENQKQRWIKYGGNVALSVIIVVVLAVLAVVIAQRTDKRFDVTANRMYSLKPQTLNIIKDLKQPIKIVSLYSRPQTDQAGAADLREQADVVTDLLQEYKSQGKNIEVESIDPTANQAKVDDLYTEVTSKYGGEIKKYKAFLDQCPAKLDAMHAIVGDEATAIGKIETNNQGTDDASQMVARVSDAILQLPKALEQAKDAVTRRLAQKHPDYKTATTSIQTTMTLLSQEAGALSDLAAKIKTDNSYPKPFVAYLTGAAPHFDAVKKMADDLNKQIDQLGALKVDDLRQSLREANPVLVLGQDDMRVLPYAQVWKTQTQAQMMVSSDGKLRPVFTGEQEISTAILGLENPKKPKVCIVRNGGAPMTTPGFPPFQAGGPLSEVADRLRQYNFDVLEKDLSGTYALQAQMQGGPPAEEPSDQEIRDAIWVVLATPPQQGQMGQGPLMAPKVIEHLKQGGSALLCMFPQGEDFAPELANWGVQAFPNVVDVHSLVKTDRPQGDYLEEAQRLPFVFDITQYGDAFLAKPLKSLRSFMVPLLAVRTMAAKGAKVEPLIPIPQDPKSWGETDLEGLQKGDDPKFQAESGDLENTPANPLYGGAAVERDGGARLVVIGSGSFMFNRFLEEPDPELAQRRVFVARFPGNAELFCDSVFWLAHMEPMIAISPAAMEVSRIGEMSEATLRAWRVGFLLLGLPGIVILFGVVVYFSRRD